MKKDISLYIHIPFCVRKCAYCDFLSFSAADDIKLRYVERLVEEIKAASHEYKDRTVISVFFGGGTPSVLSGDQIGRIMDVFGKKYDISDNAEISIETNPGTVSSEKYKEFIAAGINRLSIGCQSLNDKELKLLGRIHREEDFYKAYLWAREAGCNNINVDIMSALPGQSARDYESNLNKLLELKPEHISAYSLIIEEGTPFYERFQHDVAIRNKGGIPEWLPDEDEERKMLYSGRDMLTGAGYHQYEISNYALTGYECRHNKVYWLRGDYAGFGLGAASCVAECRWKNTEDINEYLSAGTNSLRKDIQQLDVTQQRSEAMFLGLRLINGIDIEQYSHRYGAPPMSLYGEWIGKMIDEGLMIKRKNRIALTIRGQDVANYVWGGFI